jgi:flavodoxin
MNIGIIVYSQTGNTLSVAQRMKDSLLAAGHAAQIDRITVGQTPAMSASGTLDHIPSADGYDAVIFGAPVQGFSLCRPMAKYLKQLPDLHGLPVACFVTQALARKWMGGNHAWNTMRALLMQKGAEPRRIGHVHWHSQQRDAQIADAVTGAMKFAATAKP